MDTVEKTKFCKHCGSTIAADAVICTSCGRQVEEIRQQQEQPQIVINNSNSKSTQTRIRLQTPIPTLP